MGEENYITISITSSSCHSDAAEVEMIGRVELAHRAYEAWLPDPSLADPTRSGAKTFRRTRRPS